MIYNLVPTVFPGTFRKISRFLSQWKVCNVESWLGWLLNGSKLALGPMPSQIEDPHPLPPPLQTLFSNPIQWGLCVLPHLPFTVLPTLKCKTIFTFWCVEQTHWKWLSSTQPGYFRSCSIEGRGVQVLSWDSCIMRIVLSWDSCNEESTFMRLM